MSAGADMLAVARDLATELAGEGAHAVVLVGSWARGDAHRESDIDLHALGVGPAYQLRRREPFLVSIAWRSPEWHRAALTDPLAAGAAVPGWRGALPLHDPRGVAAGIQREARDWTWERLDPRAIERAVADEIAGFSEEVHKLVIARERGAHATAAVQRAVLALRLARPLALHHRILYDSENVLWDHVADAMGATWQRAQAVALGVTPVAPDIANAAALELFALACAAVWPLFDARERTVVEHALALAGYPRAG